MKHLIPCAAAAALLFGAAGSATAAASVKYAQPEHFADVPFATTDRERVLKELSGHFDTLAAKLPPGQELKVEVLDVDLAGQVRYDYPSNPNLRVLRGQADWPQMRFRYTIEQDGKVVKSGEERVSDMSYLQRMNRYTGSDTLRYEKQMLDDWFKQAVAMR